MKNEQAPPDPSPTPEDHNTWGFYCDHCGLFFDLILEGRVLTQNNTNSYEHKKCGHSARYIGYESFQFSKIFAWLGMIVETYDLRLGEFEASFDESRQVQIWHCLGCNAEHYSTWPNWKINFIHKPECMYMKLQTLIDKALEL